jgi:hypothetical protein
MLLPHKPLALQGIYSLDKRRAYAGEGFFDDFKAENCEKAEFTKGK